MNRLEYLFGNTSAKINRITWIIILVIISQAIVSLLFIVYMGFFAETAKIHLSNIASLIGDPRHLQAIVNSIYIALFVSVLLSLLSITFALLFRYCEITGNTLVYSLSIIPLLIPDQVFGVVGKALFDPTIGVFSQLAPKTLLIDRFSSLMTVSVITIAKWLPAMIVVADTSILRIGKEKLIQIELDFKSFFGAAWKVYIPQMKHIIYIIFSLGFLIGFRQHELARELTGGGGGFSAETWSIWNYRSIFEFNEISIASIHAGIVLLFLLIPLLVIKKQAQMMYTNK